MIEGVPIAPRNPKQMLALGLAYLPEDRDGVGLIMAAPIVSNVTLPILARLARRGLVDDAAGRRIAEEAVETYRVRTTGIDQVVADLSGGNRQKVAFARWMSTQAEGSDSRRADPWRRCGIEGADLRDDRATGR